MLVICEKPDAARHIARALGKSSVVKMDGTDIFIVNDRVRYVICSAFGHLYNLEDLSGDRKVYPVFDPQWRPLSEKGKRERAKSIISLIGRLAEKASGFINACDLDQEGEVIAYNILEYACNNNYRKALRAKFSTLTMQEIREAFEHLEPNINYIRLAEAGRSRHLLDFIYGVNLSRALTNTARGNVTIGRVQGPILSFIVEREIEIQTHLPYPYWNIIAKFSKGEEEFNASYETVLHNIDIVKTILNECKGKDGKVIKVDTRKNVLKAPAPFNLGDLQHEAYRYLRISPSLTLEIAERLYLAALISYPRTSSQKIPDSINYRGIISSISKMSKYAKLARELLSRNDLKPNNGIMEDPAHPAIHPTGEIPCKLNALEWRIYDLIVRRFLATFADPAIVEEKSVIIDLAGYDFISEGKKVLKYGWFRFYDMHYNSELPDLRINDLVKNKGIKSKEEFTKPKPRFNPDTLLSTMEREHIGTKATRAMIIDTLIKRNYITKAMEPTELGFSLIESMHECMPEILSTDLTRAMEERLEEIENGSLDSSNVIDEASERLNNVLDKFRASEEEIGRRIREARSRMRESMNILGRCPLCSGTLRIVRSRKSGKRFAACSNYKKGCRGSMPLPQKGSITSLGKECQTCGYPLILVRAPYTWKMCINIECESKRRSGSKE